jgi:hypothetical protein
MPLLHFVGLSNVGKSFSIAFCFLKSELKSDYIWALKAFSACFNKCPDVFVTDYEMALINASYEVFPNTANLLCIWHINKNVLKIADYILKVWTNITLSLMIGKILYI